MANTYFEMKDVRGVELTLTAKTGPNKITLQITLSKGNDWKELNLTDVQIWELAYQLTRRAGGEVSATEYG